jgi:hypothetical protein
LPYMQWSDITTEKQALDFYIQVLEFMFVTFEAILQPTFTRVRVQTFISLVRSLMKITSTVYLKEVIISGFRRGFLDGAENSWLLNFLPLSIFRHPEEHKHPLEDGSRFCCRNIVFFRITHDGQTKKETLISKSLLYNLNANNKM